MTHKQVATDLLPHLPARFMTAREIWRRLDCWSPTTIRHALDELFREEVVDRISEKTPSGVRYLYRRASA